MKLTITVEGSEQPDLGRKLQAVVPGIIQSLDEAYYGGDVLYERDIHDSAVVKLAHMRLSFGADIQPEAPEPITLTEWRIHDDHIAEGLTQPESCDVCAKLSQVAGVLGLDQSDLEYMVDEVPRNDWPARYGDPR